MENPSNGDLVNQTRAGSRTAFNDLIERHQAFALRMALRLIAHAETAADIVQEALLQAFLSLDHLREPERFRSWLIGIVVNLCKNYLRENKKDLNLLHDSLETNEGDLADSSARTPLEITIERELHELVLKAASELPSAQKDAFLLFYYDSLSIAEISAISGVSMGAVKVRLHRARQQVRGQVENEFRESTSFMKPDQERMKHMNEVVIADIVKQENKKHIVLLKEKNGKRVLPIWVGSFEAASIAMGLRAFPTVRPLTFSFIASLLQALDAELVEARIETLRETIFFGIARVRSSSGEREVDARPSDVLALAVRTGCPLFVADEVMETAVKTTEELRSLVGENFLPLGQNMEMILDEIKAELTPPPTQEESQPE